MEESKIIARVLRETQKTPEQKRQDMQMADMVYKELKDMVESGEANQYSEWGAANEAWQRVFRKLSRARAGPTIKGKWVMPPAGQLKYNEPKVMPVKPHRAQMIIFGGRRGNGKTLLVKKIIEELIAGGKV